MEKSRRSTSQCCAGEDFKQTNTASLFLSAAFLDILTKPKRGPCVGVYMSQLCVGGYSLAAVTLAGTLARAPAPVLATHWYRPRVRLDKEGMNRLLGLNTVPKSPFSSSWPLRRQLMLAEAGWALQRRVTVPPSFCTTEAGSLVNTGTSSGKNNRNKLIRHMKNNSLTVRPAGWISLSRHFF